MNAKPKRHETQTSRRSRYRPRGSLDHAPNATDWTPFSLATSSIPLTSLWPRTSQRGCCYLRKFLHNTCLMWKCNCPFGDVKISVGSTGEMQTKALLALEITTSISGSDQKFLMRNVAIRFKLLPVTCRPALFVNRDINPSPNRLRNVILNLRLVSPPAWDPLFRQYVTAISLARNALTWHHRAYSWLNTSRRSGRTSSVHASVTWK